MFQTMHNEDIFLQIALTKNVLELSIIGDANKYSITLTLDNINGNNKNLTSYYLHFDLVTWFHLRPNLIPFLSPNFSPLPTVHSGSFGSSLKFDPFELLGD